MHSCFQAFRSPFNNAEIFSERRETVAEQKYSEQNDKMVINRWSITSVFDLFHTGHYRKNTQSFFTF